MGKKIQTKVIGGKRKYFFLVELMKVLRSKESLQIVVSCEHSNTGSSPIKKELFYSPLFDPKLRTLEIGVSKMREKR